jgi:glutamate transport system permease protein
MTIIVGAIYIGLCLILSFIATSVEKRLRRSPRVPGVTRADVVAQEMTDTQLIATQTDARTGNAQGSQRL